MVKLVLTGYQRKVYRILAIQAAVIAVLSLACAVFIQPIKGASLLLGGAIYLVPTFFYANRVFSNLSVHALGKIMVTFYLGELLKLCVTVGLFIMLYQWLALPLLPFTVGYIVAALSFCVVPMFVLDKGVTA